MWWLLDALLLFQSAEDLRTPAGRRDAVQGCLAVLAIGAFAAFLAFIIIAANSKP